MPAGAEGFILEAVGMFCALLGSLTESRAEMVLAFDLHGSVEQHSKQRRQSIQTVGRELF